LKIRLTCTIVNEFLDEVLVKLSIKTIIEFGH